MPKKGDTLDGGDPLICTLNTRVSQATRDRVDQIAAECDVSVTAWVREVIAQWVAAYDALPPDEDVIDDDPEPLTGDINPGESPVDYETRVADAARVDREAARLTRQVKPKKVLLNPRECPHMPTRRAGSKCRDCGMRLGGMTPGYQRRSM